MDANMARQLFQASSRASYIWGWPFPNIDSEGAARNVAAESMVRRRRGVARVFVFEDSM
jgi:hypothetical protein